MKTATAVFAQNPKLPVVTATTAFALTGALSLIDNAPENTVLLHTAGVEGSMVTTVKAIPRATCVKTMLALFIKKAGDGGTIRRLIATETMQITAIDADSKIEEVIFDIASEADPLRLEPGDELYVGIGVTNANGINFVCRAVDY